MNSGFVYSSVLVFLLGLSLDPLTITASPADFDKGSAEETSHGDDAFTLETIETKSDTGSVTQRYQARVYADGRQVKHGESVEFRQNGEAFRRGSYLEGKRHGKWDYVDADGQLTKEGSYTNGALEGNWSFYSDGKLIRLESYQAGLPHGRWTRYSVESEMALDTREYRHGKLHGIVSLSYSNGKPKRYATYVDGVLQGEKREWHDNGRLSSSYTYDHGKRHGRQQRLSRSGQVLQDIEYVHDEPQHENSRKVTNKPEP